MTAREMLYRLPLQVSVWIMAYYGCLLRFDAPASTVIQETPGAFAGVLQ